MSVFTATAQRQGVAGMRQRQGLTGRRINVLIINHYAGSDRMGMEYRPFYLAREWVEAGHKVTIVAANWSHLRANQPRSSKDLEVTTEEGVRFRWLHTNKYEGSGIARVANMVTFVSKLQLYAARLAIEETPDVVICSSTYPLDIYPGERIARRAGARLIFEVHDLWPLSPMLLGGYSRRHPFIRVLQRAEDHAYRAAASVVSLLPHANDYMVTRGLLPTKFVHIPNGVPVDRLLMSGDPRLSDDVEKLVKREGDRGNFLVGFAGSANFTSTDFDTLLTAANLLSSAGVSFVIAGDGPDGPLLRKRASSCRADNLHLVGRLPKSAIPKFLSLVDTLVVPLHRSPLYRFGISLNKIFDYMLAEKPIVQASDCRNDLISEADCGLTVAPGDPVALADGILRIRALPQAERQRLGKNGRSFVIKNHDYRVLARQFLAVMRN